LLLLLLLPLVCRLSPAAHCVVAAAAAADSMIDDEFVVSEESVAATLEEVTKLLEEVVSTDADTDAENNGSLLSRASMQTVSDIVVELVESIGRLESLVNEVETKEARINELLNVEHARQMEDLAVRLQETFEREMMLRERERHEEKRLEEERNRNQQSKLEELRFFPSRNESSALASALASSFFEITSEDLEERLRSDVIIEQSEAQMKNWMLSVIEEELAQYKQEVFGKADQIDASGDSNNNNNSNNNNANNNKNADGSPDCPSVTSIVQKVQQALNDNAEDGIGRVDHAQGASVVYWLTSDTHTPPALPSQTLGSVWWSQYIPQDWERLFPPGWEKCRVALPSYVSHSLGFVSGDVAPPEAIVEKNTLPGSCWPMKGSSGQVVLKLARPVVVEAVSIDHVARGIVPEGKRNSAPKHLKIIGYPPCDYDDNDDDDDDKKCKALGFDMYDPLDIADIHYDLAGRSVQTFESHYAKAMASLPNHDLVVSDEGEQPGSCSVQTSCSAPPRISVAAVAVNVLENWGNQDFTCLYRVRLHGDPDDSSSSSSRSMY